MQVTGGKNFIIPFDDLTRVSQLKLKRRNKR